MPLPPKLAVLLARLPTAGQLVSMIVPAIALGAAGVYTYRHYASGGGSRNLVDPNMFKEDWSSHAKEVMRMLREYEAAQGRARAATGACGDAAAHGFTGVSSVPYSFDPLTQDEGGGPLGGTRCGVAANPKISEKEAWVYLLLIEDGRGEILMAQYPAVGKRLTAWPSADLRAKFRGLGSGIGTAPGAPDAPAGPDAPPALGPAVSTAPLLSQKELNNVRAKRLMPILSEINEEGSPMGVKFSLDDLLVPFRDVERRLIGGSLEGLTELEAGLNPPATEELDAEDQAANTAVKCLVAGEWKYLNDLPVSSDGGVTECRRKGRGKDKRGFEIVAWVVHDHYSPLRATWSPFSDEEYARAVDEVVTQKYEALPDPDPAKHAEIVQARYARWDKVRRVPGQAAMTAEASLRKEILAAYDKKIKVAAGRHVVELITGTAQP